MRRWFRALLQLLPRDVRGDYGRQMEADFADELSGAGGRTSQLVVTRRNTTAMIALGFRLHLEQAGQDLRHALRAMRRAPTFTVAAVAALAFGIGSTVTLFAMADAFFFKPLPFADPASLVHIWGADRARGLTELRVSYQEFERWRARTEVLDDAAVFNYTSVELLAGDDQPASVPAGLVSANAFSILGVPAILGRTLQPGDDRPGAPPVVVIGEAFWRARFGADETVVGSTLRIAGTPHTIVGVMPARFPFPLPTTRLWVARTLDAARYPPDVQPFQVVARLRAGVTPETALAALESDSAALGDANPALAGRTPHIESLRAGLNFADDILSIGAVVVGAATLLVLVAACANISSLMLGRAVGRSREVAVRTAIGAGRFRLVRQFLVESLALAAAGAAAGLALAVVGVRGVDGLIDADIFRAAPLAIDGRAAAIAVGLAVGSALLFGLAPAFQFARTRVSQALRQEGTSATASRRSLRLQSAFVVAQVAVSVVLLVGTIVAARSVTAMSRLDLGFAPDAVQTLQMSLPAARYPDADARARFHRDLRQRLAGATGVAGVATVDFLPLNYESRVDRVDAVGSVVPPASAGADAQVITVSAGYFDVLQTPLVAGRDFDAADTAARVPVAIVNRTFAARHWPGRDAVGGTFRLDDRPAFYTVVGVVGNTRQIDLASVDRAQVFLAQGQAPRSYLRVLVRASGDPAAALPVMTAAVREIDPLLPVNDPRTLRQVVDAFLLPQRALRVVLLGIGGVSLCLALIGIYGIVSCHVADRTREMGIRAALGASRRRLLGAVLRRGVILAIAGAAAGLAIGVVSVWGVRGVLPGIEPGGPAAYVGLAVLVIAVAALAGLGPARRAARTSPVVAMK